MNRRIGEVKERLLREQEDRQRREEAHRKKRQRQQKFVVARGIDLAQREQERRAVAKKSCQEFADRMLSKGAPGAQLYDVLEQRIIGLFGSKGPTEVKNPDRRLWLRNKRNQIPGWHFSTAHDDNSRPTYPGGYNESLRKPAYKSWISAEYVILATGQIARRRGDASELSVIHDFSSDSHLSSLDIPKRLAEIEEETSLPGPNNFNHYELG